MISFTRISYGCHKPLKMTMRSTRTPVITAAAALQVLMPQQRYVSILTKMLLPSKLLKGNLLTSVITQNCNFSVLSAFNALSFEELYKETN